MISQNNADIQLRILNCNDELSGVNELADTTERVTKRRKERSRAIEGIYVSLPCPQQGGDVDRGGKSG